MFEAKTYNDVRNTIGAANCLFAIVFILAFYGVALSSQHAKTVLDLLSKIRLDPIFSGVLSIALLAAVWTYVSTFLLRLHDSIYEPFLVKWRASYDADFILRALCFPYFYLVSPRLFEEAYDDKKKRRSFMSRLFYKFVGDETKEHLATLTFFYTDMRNYWVLALAELYCLSFLLLALLYSSFFSSRRNIIPLLLVMAILTVAFRICANFYLDKPRQITRDQIRAVLQDHQKEFEVELKALLHDYNLKG